MVDISSQNNKINITVSSSGNTANTNVTPDYAQYYSEKSKEWAISNRIVDNTDYSSKYYANESKKQADISTAKATEVVESGNTAVSNIENARNNAILDVNTAGATQVALATEQATIATNKTSEVVESGNTALANIDTAKNNAITSITNQETTSKTSLIDEGATQIGLIQNEGATQVANVQSTGFYMRDDKLYYINSQGEETEFKSGGSGLELCDIGMALYVDETKGLRRRLNGSIMDITSNYQAFLTRLKEITTLYPSLVCTEEEWQTAKTMSAFGQVGKFVFNYADDGVTVVSVRIPRVVNVQGLFDLQNLGMTVREKLPNIQGGVIGDIIGNYASLSDTAVTFTGAFKGVSTYAGTIQSGSNHYQEITNLSLDASKASSTYQNNAPVQQEAIQYPYFIQIATGSETENNIINDIELNNPYSLFDSKYSDHELNNLSWLKSEGQWNSKAVYPTAYDKLLKVYNGTETVEGLSVKLSTETYTDYDFVLNTAEETFRLPLKNHTADDGNSVLTLYYYVGETVQNANLIDAGRIGEQLANKVDISNTQWATNACMPDYDNGIAIGRANKYEALVDGYYVGRTTVASGTNSTTRITAVLYNNSETLAVSFTNSGYDNISGNSKFSTINFPVPKGYKITVGDILGSLITSNFYPMKGAN